MDISSAVYFNTCTRAVIVENRDNQSEPEVRLECCVPSVERLMTGVKEGGRTVRVGSTVYQFQPGPKTMASICEGMLLEDPDKVAGKYKRLDYLYKVWLGDENGCFIAARAASLGHGDLLRLLVKAGTVNGAYEVVGKCPPSVEMIGNPKSVKFQYSGTILPRQDGVDGTYISCWTKDAESKIVCDYAITHYSPPYFIERNMGEDMMSDSFVVSPL